MAKNIGKQLPSGVNFGDITFVLFKHKWKILLLCIISFLGAAAYYWKAKVNYMSQAKLMVRYIIEESPLDQVNSKTDTGGNRESIAIINGEMQILTSWDLAESVAQAVAEELMKINAKESGVVNMEEISIAKNKQLEQLEKEAYLQLIGEWYEGEISKSAAATAILRNLTISADSGDSVINLAYRHQDRRLPRMVLNEYVRLYLQKHLKIHRSLDTTALVDKEREKAKFNLDAKNELLQSLLSKYGILSLADGTQRFNSELVAAQGELKKAEADYAEQSARVAALERGIMDKAEEGSPNSRQKSTKQPHEVQINSAVLEEYRTVVSRLAQAREAHNQALVKFTPGNIEVRKVQNQIDSLLGQRSAIEKSHPELLFFAPSSNTVSPLVDIASQKAELDAIMARKDQLKSSYEFIEKKCKEFAVDVPAIASAQKALEIAEENYKFFEINSQKAQAETLLKNGNIPNISRVQDPSPAEIDVKTRNKIAVGILLVGPVLGIGLVFLFGIFLNRTIKRPIDIEEGMGLPLLMAIPYFSRRKRRKSLFSVHSKEEVKALKTSESNSEPWEKYHFIQPFAEALRDRLTMYFEATGNVRKPKLIAVTGYSKGAGATTLSAGLASSLSQIGEGKVLLVDMNGKNGAAHPFLHGAPALSLTKAIGTSLTDGCNLENGGFQNNLFVARADSAASGATSVGLRRMLPQLKTSDFDYIIFDMPPLGQTKPTATMAGLMDKVIVVVEAEANTRSDVRRGYRDLMDAAADVSIVFNKARAHGPAAIVGSVS